MKVGFIGLGKLGLPCALAIESKGHSVIGYDVDPERMQKNSTSYQEEGPQGEPSILPFLQKSNLRFGNINDVVSQSEIIFVAVQTPHNPLYEGSTRIPETRVDFNYEYLIEAMKSVSTAVAGCEEKKTVVIISTVLPGTLRKHIVPLLHPNVQLCYNPFFIAMGTAMRDFLNPEFVLFGVVDQDAADKAERFYRSIHSAPFYRTTLENAELIKVAYNTFIGMKIVFANTLMEICHHTPNTNVDDVVNALCLAKERLISGKYLQAGMGDGGGCHPRDNIALSWLAQNLGLSYDWFEGIMTAREKQTEWLALMIAKHARESGLPITILGKSFKPKTNIVTGSPAILLFNIIREMGHNASIYDPYVDAGSPPPTLVPSVFCIATKHPDFARIAFSQGSIVIDPWRYIPKQNNVSLIQVGSHTS